MTATAAELAAPTTVAARLGPLREEVVFGGGIIERENAALFKLAVPLAFGTRHVPPDGG